MLDLLAATMEASVFVGVVFDEVPEQGSLLCSS
jgi:hypothetical protein